MCTCVCERECVFEVDPPTVHLQYRTRVTAELKGCRSMLVRKVVFPKN